MEEMAELLYLLKENTLYYRSFIKLPKQPFLSFKVKLAADFGNMYGKNVGMLLGIVNRGWMGE